VSAADRVTLYLLEIPGHLGSARRRLLYIQTITLLGLLCAAEAAINHVRTGHQVTLGTLLEPETAPHRAPLTCRYLGLLKVNLDTRKLVPGLQPLLLGGANSSRNVQQDPAILELLQQFAGPVEAMKTTVTGWCGDSSHAYISLLQSSHNQSRFVSCLV
jgi:hypothetical protein